MKILITGGTGLIGSRLAADCVGAGYEVTILTRDPVKAAKRFAEQYEYIGSLQQWTEEKQFQAVINLNGAPIVGRRWTQSRKKVLWQSRVEFTESLVSHMAGLRVKPEVLISGSAVGYYGDQGASQIDESAAGATDFGAQLCAAWEVSAQQAENLGIRVCMLRTGLVLSSQGGMLGQMIVPYKLGLGARIGKGEQYMSWIHIDDQVNAIKALLADSKLSGRFNLTAPHAVTNKDFTGSLARALKRPTFMVAPEFLIRLLMGESADLLLTGQNVYPARLLESGFQFQFDKLDRALADLLV